MRFSLTLVLLTAFWVLPVVLYAQPQAIHFERLTVDDGLSMNMVFDVLQDRQGFMWIGTQDGLNRYDGYHVTIYRHNPEDSTSLSLNWIQSLYEDQQGMLWVATQGGGLNRFDPQIGRFTRYLHDPGDSTSLSNDWVNELYEDREGTLWIATGDGLNRYDRQADRFTRYVHDPDDPEASSNGWIMMLREDRLGMLWVGTWGDGLSRFDLQTGRFTRYLHDPGNPTSVSSNHIWTVLEDHEGMLWVATDNGLNRFDPQTKRFTRYLHDPGDPTSVSSNRVYHLSQDREGILWIGTERGLNRYDRQTGRFTRYLHDPADAASLSENVISLIQEDSQGTLWIGTEGGLNRFDRQTERFIRYVHDPGDATSLGNGQIQSFYEDPRGMVWIGTWSGGLSGFDTQAGYFTRYRHSPARPASLSNNQIWAFHEDREEMLWVATDNGLNRLDPQTKRFTRYLHDPDDLTSLSDNEIRALYEDQEGMLWVGTWGGGLNRLNRQTGRFTRYLHDPDDPASVSSNWVVRVYEDRAGMLWAGTYKDGLNQFDRQTERFTRYRHDPNDSTSLASDQIWSLYGDREGTFWVGTSDGLNRYDRQRGRFTRYVHDPDDPTSLSNNSIFLFYEDREGTFWVGTTEGLNRYDRQADRFTQYRPDAGDSTSLTNGWIMTLHEDRRGAFWVATQGGLHRLDRQTGRFTRFTERNSDLPNDAVYDILEDDQGYLWISTVRGLARFDPGTETFQTYGLDRGLQSLEFNDEAAHKSRRGEFFFGGVNGINAFFPEQIVDNPDPPQVALTDFKLFNESVLPSTDGPLRVAVNVADDIRLDYDENFIAFEFAGLHYSNPAGNRYAFMLEGFDPTWYEAGAERTATYTNLDPGTYTFRVKAASAYGVWSEEEAGVRVVVFPPLWQTWWAYALYALLLASAFYAGDRVRRVRLEDRLKAEAAEEQAKGIQELSQLKSRFFINVSHEFRTPLTLILGPLHDFLDGAYGDVSERHRQQLTIMQRNGARLLQLINQLLDLSRLEAGRLHLHARRADLVPFLKRLVATFASRAERMSILLQFHTDLETASLYFDADKLEKVFVNLLSNAFKFTVEGGKIRLAVEEGADEENGFIDIVVKDTGQGIPAEELPYIFDRFRQADASTTRAHEGTGIGLALVKELVALHGGEVRVESELGFGTTFYVRLRRGVDHLDPADVIEEEPAVAAEGPPVASAQTLAEGIADEADPEPDDALPDDAPLVLVVEDNADVRAYLRSHLAGRYRIVEAEDGVEGLEKARAAKPALVLSDVMMPKMDGYELCRALKADATLNHIPVILLTAKADEESKVEGLETGADDYLYKPFSAAELMARAENLIEIRRILRQRFSGEVVVGPRAITVPSAEAAFLEQVREVVEAYLGERTFGVDRLAEEVGLSKRQVQRRLRATTDLSAAGYIRTMRLQRAAQLLEQQTGTVSEIAYAVGFQDARHFAKLFQQVYGVLPSRYSAETG